MTNTSTDALVGCSRNPSCCWIAVNKSGGASASGAGGGAFGNPAQWPLRRIRRPLQHEVVTLRAESRLIHYRLIHKLRLHHVGKFRYGRIPDIESALRRTAETGYGNRIIFFFGDLWPILRHRNRVNREFLMLAVERQREAVRQ